MAPPPMRGGGATARMDQTVVLVGLSHLVPDIGGKLCQYQGMGGVVGEEITGQVV